MREDETIMEKTSLKNPLLLFLTAVIWGVAFVAQSVGMDYVGPFTFNFVRCLLGAASLVPCIWFLDWSKRRSAGDTGKKLPEKADAETGQVCTRDTALQTARKYAAGQSGAKHAAAQTAGEHAAGRSGAKYAAGQPAASQTTAGRIGRTPGRKSDRTLLAGGISCGVALFAASNLQQFGIQYTTVGKAGFITALYIVLVPILGIFLKKKVGARVWVSVALAVAGLYLLCITEAFAIGTGDLLVLLCALVFSVHILVIDYFSPKVDGVRMSCIQFFVCGLLSGVGMLLTETPDLHEILRAWMPIGYAGVFSCGVAYTLQIIGQKGTDPTVASLILSLESVVSVLAGWLLLGQALSAKEMTGCVLMFAAILLAQLPQKRRMDET